MGKCAFILCVLAGALICAACDSATPTVQQSTQSTNSSPLTPTTLHVLIPPNALDPNLYDMFTRETQIQIVEQPYRSDAELHEQLAQADLLITTERNISALREQLAPLNAANIPNFQYVEARLKHLAFDADNRVSVPLVWGTVGLLFRTDLAKADASWAVLWNAQRAAKVALLDDPRLGIGTGLKWLGFSLNSTSQLELMRARDLMLKQHGTIRIDSAAWSDALLTGEVGIAQARSDDAAFAQSASANLRYVIPREGAPLWMMCIAVPNNSAHQALAEALANFLLRADIVAQVSTYTYSLPSVPDAYHKMDANLANLYRSGYIPDDETFKRSEFVTDVGTAHAEYDRLWSELKNRRWSMLYELRIYHATPGKLSALHNRFETITLKFWQQYGIRPVGFWTTVIGESNNDLYYLLAWESLAERERTWTAFATDPEWIKARGETEKDGSLTTQITNLILTPTRYSAMQ